MPFAQSKLGVNGNGIVVCPLLVPQGQPVAEAVRSIGLTQFTNYRCRQVKRLKEFETEDERLPAKTVRPTSAFVKLRCCVGKRIQRPERVGGDRCALRLWKLQSRN